MTTRLYTVTGKYAVLDPDLLELALKAVGRVSFAHFYITAANKHEAQRILLSLGRSVPLTQVLPFNSPAAEAERRTGAVLGASALQKAGALDTNGRVFITLAGERDGDFIAQLFGPTREDRLSGGVMGYRTVGRLHDAGGVLVATLGELD